MSDRTETDFANPLPHQLQLIFDHAPFGICYLDRKHVCIAANPFIYRLLGLSPEQLLGRSCFDIFGEQADNPYRSGDGAICSHSRIEDLHNSDNPLISERPFGDRWLRIHIIPQLDEHGKLIGLLNILEDITGQRQAEQARSRALNRLQGILDSIGDPMLVIGNDYRLKLINRPALHNAPDPDALSCHQFSHGLKHPCGGDDHPCPLEQVNLTGETATVLHRHIHRDGSEHHIEIVASPLLDAAGRIEGIVESHRDITERIQLERELQRLATTDQLTGVYNRGRFEAVVNEEIARIRRYREPLSLIMFDLDDFKQINDQHGHAAGDRVLREVVKTVRANIRLQDSLARWGGEEFMLLAPATDLAGASELAEKLCSAIAGIQCQDGIRISASFGVTQYRRLDDLDELARRADQALYHAKQHGKSRVECMPS